MGREYHEGFKDGMKFVLNELGNYYVDSLEDVDDTLGLIRQEITLSVIDDFEEILEEWIDMYGEDGFESECNEGCDGGNPECCAECEAAAQCPASFCDEADCDDCELAVAIEAVAIEADAEWVDRLIDVLHKLRD